MDDFNKDSQPEEQLEPDFPEEPYRFKPPSRYPLISPVAAAFIGLFGGFFLYQIAGGILTVAVFGIDLDKAPLNGLRLITIATQILFILLPALLFAKWIYGNVSEVISVKLPDWKEFLLFILGIIILTPLLQSYLYIQNYFIEKLAANSVIFNSLKTELDKFNDLMEKTYLNLMNASNGFELVLVVFTIAIIPAICEEVMFRGYIQHSFAFKMKPFWAALITAVFFGLNHFNPYGILPLIALGLYFGFAAYMSSSLAVPIVLHFLNNFFAVLMYFILEDDELISSNVTDPAALNSSILYFVLFSLLFAGLIILIKNYYSRMKTV